MNIELHCHSNRSDGKLTPSEIATKALTHSLEYFCLTDHDTTEGFSEVSNILGAKALLGVEVSCIYKGRTAHLLVYEGDGNWGPIEEILSSQRTAREERAVKIVAKLKKLGIALDTKFLEHKQGSVGRPDIADALVSQGHCKTRRDAFNRWLGDDKPANVMVSRLELRDAVILAKENELPASLAHPHTLSAHVSALYDEIQPLGLNAIEALYGPYETPERKKWIRFAKQRNLVCTGGSDFHGVGKVESVGVVIEAPYVSPLRDWLKL